MSFEPSDENLDEIFEMMLMVGALEINGIDENNEPIYRVTEKCKDIFPEFYAMHQETVNQITFDLWKLGVVDITFFDDETRVSFRKHNLERYLELEDTLSDEQISVVDTLMTKNLREHAKKYLD
jgi:hypothetical protein